jgi:hypothetical protein
MPSWTYRSGLLVSAGLLVLAACRDVETTSSTAPDLSARRAPDAGAQLAACETSESSSSSATIGPNGGVLSAGPVIVAVPPSAVRTPTRFTVQPLAGSTLRVRITARGRERFGFARPIAVMIGYAHCSRQEFRGILSVWHVDDVTNAPLEQMPSVHDRQNSTVGFLTGHLSTYAVAH